MDRAAPGGTREADEDGDGRYERRREERRDAADRHVSSEEYTIGNPRSEPSLFERDEHGHVTLMTQWYRDGRPDHWPTALTHDACGNLLRAEHDYKGDGEVDLIVTYQYDCGR